MGALALRRTRPVTAGILLGCLTFKPQLGILFPFLLLFERNWTMIASAALTAAALADAQLLRSELTLGWDIFKKFFPTKAL